MEGAKLEATFCRSLVLVELACTAFILTPFSSIVIDMIGWEG
jgi:hypothetical protein